MNLLQRSLDRCSAPKASKGRACSKQRLQCLCCWGSRLTSSTSVISGSSCFPFRLRPGWPCSTRRKEARLRQRSRAGNHGRETRYENVTNAIKGATTSNVAVRGCKIAKGVDGITGVTLCDQYGPAFSFSALTADPEAPVYALNRVDVEYTVAPVIPGAAFSIVLPNLQFHRQVSMRSLF